MYYIRFGIDLTGVSEEIDRELNRMRAIINEIPVRLMKRVCSCWYNIIEECQTNSSRDAILFKRNILKSIVQIIHRLI